ncbi:hypothetical protein WICPIJ_004367 [Wickerhamomyces pijperi]|uniref:Uncharacterized protein n=1 Tax=Wickerhamomyces pijperi TaxID=599730 RepID=A0A9P8TNC3_WICPI|nr:hypothetical protein WICPIJ_004367 [Wickerhamomyces pijperi]
MDSFESDQVHRLDETITSGGIVVQVQAFGDLTRTLLKTIHISVPNDKDFLVVSDDLSGGVFQLQSLDLQRVCGDVTIGKLKDLQSLGVNRHDAVLEVLIGQRASGVQVVCQQRTDVQNGGGWILMNEPRIRGQGEDMWDFTDWEILIPPGASHSLVLTPFWNETILLARICNSPASPTCWTPNVASVNTSPESRTSSTDSPISSTSVEFKKERIKYLSNGSFLVILVVKILSAIPGTSLSTISSTLTPRSIVLKVDCVARPDSASIWPEGVTEVARSGFKVSIRSVRDKLTSSSCLSKSQAWESTVSTAETNSGTSGPNDSNWRKYLSPYSESANRYPDFKTMRDVTTEGKVSNQSPLLLGLAVKSSSSSSGSLLVFEVGIVRLYGSKLRVIIPNVQPDRRVSQNFHSVGLQWRRNRQLVLQVSVHDIKQLVSLDGAYKQSTALGIDTQILAGGQSSDPRLGEWLVEQADESSVL